MVCQRNIKILSGSLCLEDFVWYVCAVFVSWQASLGGCWDNYCSYCVSSLGEHGRRWYSVVCPEDMGQCDPAHLIQLDSVDSTNEHSYVDVCHVVHK